MHIAWGNLLIVFLVSFAAAVTVVVLVALALVSLSGGSAATLDTGGGTVAATGTGKAVAGVCLAAAGLVVLYGLYVIVAA